MSDKDVDAQFADIIAHWNDAPVEPDRAPRLPAAEPSADFTADSTAEPVAAEPPTSDPAAADATAGTEQDGPPPGGTTPRGTTPGGTTDAAAPEATRQPKPPPPRPEPPSPPRSSPTEPPPPPRPLPGRFRFERRPDAPDEDAEPVEPPASWRSPDPVEDPEEHFEPGPTAPLPAGDLQFWGILVGLVGGPLLLLYLVLFNRDGNPLWMLAAVGMSVGGFGLLVQRLPRHRDDDDDGAVL